jgi:hypothetical protein
MHIDHGSTLFRIQRSITPLPFDGTMIFQGEVNLHLAPQIDSCLKFCDAEAEQFTPGNSETLGIAVSFYESAGPLLVSSRPRACL